MKISVAQIRPLKGEVAANIVNHKKLIELAITYKADAIVFPELSITGYEPELAKDLATTQEDKRFDDLQAISNKNKITIGVGVPTIGDTGILISVVVFQPYQQRPTYSKQKLHEEELPFFVPGDSQLFLQVGDLKIAPAICYESLQEDHADNANKLGADIYLASVAKPQRGVEKAFKHFPTISAKHSMVVMMANCGGWCDNFLSVGKSSIWNTKGDLIGQLNENDEGILIFDTETEEVIIKTIENGRDFRDTSNIQEPRIVL